MFVNTEVKPYWIAWWTAKICNNKQLMIINQLKYYATIAQDHNYFIPMVIP